MATAYVTVIERRRVVYKVPNLHSLDDAYDYQMGEEVDITYLDDYVENVEFEDVEETDEV